MSDWYANQRDQRRADQAAQAEIQRQNAAFVAEQRRRTAEHDAQMKARRAAARRARRAALFAGLPARGLSALWAAVIVLPLALAWEKQAQFAHETLGFAEPFHHAFPAAIEVAAWVCAFEAHRRGVAGRVFVRWMWILAGTAALINATHGGTWQAALSLAVLSLLGIRLHSLRTGLESGDTGQAGLTLWRRLQYPRLSLAALSIRAAQDTDAATAWTLAWVDRYGVGPAATKRERTLGTLITDRELEIDKAAARDGGLSIVNGRVGHGLAPELRDFLESQWAELEQRADTNRAEAAERIAAAEAEAAERAARAEAEAAERVAVADAARQAAEDAARQVVDDAQAAVDAAVAVYGPRVLALFGTDENAEARPLSRRATEVLPHLLDAIERREISAEATTREVIDWSRCLSEQRKGIGAEVAGQLCTEVKRLRLAPTTASGPEGQAAEPADVEHAA